MNPRAFLAAAALALVLPAQSVKEAQAAARAQTVPKLAELAEWAQEQKLFRECVRTWQVVLVLDPEHLKGRQFLRWKRNSNGRWVQIPFKEPKNLDEAKLPEFRKRRREILDPYVRTLLAALEREKASFGLEERKQQLKDLIALDPENALTRLTYAQVVREGGGSPEDPVLSGARKEELELGAQAMVEVLPEPETIEPTTLEAGMGIRWTACLGTADVRVLGCGDRAEILDAARFCQAARPLFHRAFGEDRAHRQNFTVYLLTSVADKESLLTKHPLATPALKKFVEPLSGAWLGPSTVADWSLHRARRVDGAVRQTFATMLFDAFNVSPKIGWAHEGFGTWLTYLLTGTRQTWFVRQTGYAEGAAGGLRARLSISGSDWLAEAIAQIEGGRKPDLRALFKKDVDAMDDEDLLYSYALANYLLCVRIAETPVLLRACGQGATADVALSQALATSVPDFEAAVLKWLKAITAK